MKELLAPGSLVTIAGGVLTVVGAVAYATGSANLSLPTIFYGIPILLGGLALKSSELPPARRVTPAAQLKSQRDQAAPELAKLLGDVTRWRYGQKAHLESSLEALKLWDEDNPPQLEEIEELHSADGYGLMQCPLSAGRTSASGSVVFLPRVFAPNSTSSRTIASI